MTSLIINLARYFLTIILLIFVYRIFRLISRDLDYAQKGLVAARTKRLNQRNKELLDKNSVELIVLEGDNQVLRPGQALQLRSKVTIGRSSENNLVLQNAAISKNHARIWEKQGQWWVEDLDSKNGTFVNEYRIKKPVVLANGDKVRIGDFVFQFVRCDNEVQ